MTTATISTLVGAKVLDLRIAKGWSQTDLAMSLRALGAGDLKWSQATVSQIETGKRKLLVEELEALATVFEVKVVALLNGAKT